MTSLKQKMYRIVEARKAEYMDYQDFCDLLPLVKSAISVQVDIEQYNLCKWKDFLMVGNEYETYKNNMKFTKTMLAMKALRSITASKKTLQDCIIDFINYKRLAIKSLNAHIKSFKKIDFNIVFNVDYFNYELNNKIVDIDKVKYILTDNFKKILLSERKYDKNERTNRKIRETN